ncbi:MAG: hypothetical protein ACREN5_06655 [Gemmatimonadales bacterium]
MAGENGDVTAAVTAAVGAHYIEAAQIAAQAAGTSEQLAAMLEGEAERLERAVITGFWNGLAAGRAAADLLIGITSAA